jgi:hypothetical protein
MVYVSNCPWRTLVPILLVQKYSTKHNIADTCKKSNYTSSLQKAKIYTNILEYLIQIGHIITG